MKDELPTPAQVLAARAWQEAERQRIMREQPRLTFDGDAVVVTHRINALRDNPTLRGMVRPCWPKQQHDSPEAARAQMRSILKRGLEKDASRIHIYPCPDCGKYHVGHKAR